MKYLVLAALVAYAVGSYYLLIYRPDKKIDRAD